MTRQEVFDYCKNKYGTKPDYPWDDWNAVLWHKSSRKWYGVVLEVGESASNDEVKSLIDMSYEMTK